MKKRNKPLYIKESERFLADCGFFWTNVWDLWDIKRANPDIADICDDLISWIMNR